MEKRVGNVRWSIAALLGTGIVIFILGRIEQIEAPSADISGVTETKDITAA